MPIRMIFMGPPGSGKGTQAERLAERLGIVQLSSGQVLREEIKADSQIGRKAREYVESGGLVPDEVITGVILAAMDKVAADKHLILDGFPRTLPQAEALSAGLAERNWKIDAVLDFQMDDDTIVARISGRLVCSNCGATYNKEFLPPKAEGVCDKCSGKVIQRKDDQPDVVRNRLLTYREQTAPLVRYYEERGALTRIDASAGADAVQAKVRSVIEDLGGA